MAFSLYVDQTCLSTTCIYAEYSQGHLQWSNDDGTADDYNGTLYYNNEDIKDGMIWEGPDDVCLTTSLSTGGEGELPDPSVPNNPMVVHFNYYVDGSLLTDDDFELLRADMGQDPDTVFPRQLECYHIKFNRINPLDVNNSSISVNSIEFTYINEYFWNKDQWPTTSTLDNQFTIPAFAYTYWQNEVCVRINGVDYYANTDLSDYGLEFHSTTASSVEVDLYYTALEVSTIVRTYNRDISKYIDSDLWGYVGTVLNSIPSSTGSVKAEISYKVFLHSGNAVICSALARPGFEFQKWVHTYEVNDIHDKYPIGSENYVENRQLAIDALAPITIDEEGLLVIGSSWTMSLSAYLNHDCTAVFKGIKSTVTLHDGLDFFSSHSYNIVGGSSIFNNPINIPSREGATFKGWVKPTLSDSYYTYRVSSLEDPILNELILINIQLNRIIDEYGNLIPGMDGYTDSQGNWLTDNKDLYGLWELSEYPITYEGLLIEDLDGIVYTASHNNPSTYTIVDNIIFSAPEGGLPTYYSFDRWEPEDIKAFSVTGPLTVVASWIVDVYEITLEKNNFWADQTVKIQIGTNTFKNNESIHNPQSRNGYNGFTGWFTLEDPITKNGIGELVIDLEGKLVPQVPGYTDDAGNWIRQLDTTVYAKWVPEIYTITYYLDEGDGNTEPDTDLQLPYSYTIEDEVSLGNPYGLLGAPDGKFFDGWYANDKYNGDIISTILRGTTGNKTFYGRCVDAVYNIHYHDSFDRPFSGSTAGLPVTHISGEVTPLPTTTKDGYQFDGWYLDAECASDPIVMLEASLKPYDPDSLTPSVSFGFEIYAKWAELKTAEKISVLLNTVEPKRVATYNWINNVIYEPESVDWTVRNKNSFIFTEDIKPDSLRCVGYHSLNADAALFNAPLKQITHSFFTTEFADMCTQDVYSLDIVSRNDNTVMICTNSDINKDVNGEFKSIPGLNGYYIYFTVNDPQGQIYKAEIPTQLDDIILNIPDVDIIDSIHIHRVPSYFDSGYVLVRIRPFVLANLLVIDTTPVSSLIQE